MASYKNMWEVRFSFSHSPLPVLTIGTALYFIYTCMQIYMYVYCTIIIYKYFTERHIEYWYIALHLKKFNNVFIHLSLADHPFRLVPLKGGVVFHGWSAS